MEKLKECAKVIRAYLLAVVTMLDEARTWTLVLHPDDCLLVSQMQRDDRSPALKSIRKVTVGQGEGQSTACDKGSHQLLVLGSLHLVGHLQRAGCRCVAFLFSFPSTWPFYP